MVYWLRQQIKQEIWNIVRNIPLSVEGEVLSSFIDYVLIDI